MAIFDSLASIATAPLVIADEILLKPVAEIADEVVAAITDEVE